MESIPSLPDAIRPRSTYGELRRLADGLGITVWSQTLPSGACGYYDAPTNAIIIDREQSYRAKRCTLVHELFHWSHGDVFHGTVIDDRLEHRARRETATLLIDPLEYSQAEQVYDGDVFRIAAELDVTKQVVEDYRDMVLAPMRDQCASL